MKLCQTAKIMAQAEGGGENMANILVCDDDKEIVDAVEIYLMQEGYTIFKAYDGEQDRKSVV